jgi:hypothetical protein
MHMVPSGTAKDDAFCEGVALYQKANRVVLFPQYSVSAHRLAVAMGSAEDYYDQSTFEGRALRGRAVFAAGWRREFLPRFAAAVLACRESDGILADLRGSHCSLRSVAPEPGALRPTRRY